MSENTKKEYKTYDVKPYAKEEREKILQDIDNNLLELINSSNLLSISCNIFSLSSFV